MTLTCESTTHHHRKAVRLGSDTLEAVALLGCGHLASLRLAGVDVNPLWEPPWPSLEPEAYDRARHAAQYGPVEGRLLASLAGHSLCLNHFGDLTETETEADGYFHGEASNLPWTAFEQKADVEEARLSYGLDLPEAGLRFRRQLRLRPGEATLYFKERITNPTHFDSPLFCQQHVTLGPPFVERGVTRLDLPAQRGRTFAESLGDVNPLAPDEDYSWPQAPLRDGGTQDLRIFPAQLRSLSIVTALLEPRGAISYVAVSNARLGLLLVYVFPHSIYPWTALWYENAGSEEIPWNAKTLAWGVEFGTTPFPVKRMDALTAGPLFDRPRFGTVPAGRTLEVSYQAHLFRIPSDWRGVDNVEHIDGETVVQETTTDRTVRARSAWQVSTDIRRPRASEGKGHELLER